MIRMNIIVHTILRYDPLLYKIYVNLYIKILLDIRNLPYQLTIYLYLNEIRIRRIRIIQKMDRNREGVGWRLLFRHTDFLCCFVHFNIMFIAR